MSTRLHKIDPAQNMARFYKTDVQPGLFGWSTVFEWGRIGRAGQVQLRLYDTREAAEAACQAKRVEKQRKGYAQSYF